MSDRSQKPRILGVRLGANPNSSSLSLDVTTLLFGGTGALVLGFVFSALLRGRRPAVVGTLSASLPSSPPQPPRLSPPAGGAAEGSRP